MASLEELLDDVNDAIDDSKDVLGDPPPDPTGLSEQKKLTVYADTDEIKKDCDLILRDFVDPPGSGSTSGAADPKNMGSCIADMRTESQKCRDATTDDARGSAAKKIMLYAGKLRMLVWLTPTP